MLNALKRRFGKKLVGAGAPECAPEVAEDAEWEAALARARGREESDAEWEAALAKARGAAEAADAEESEEDWEWQVAMARARAEEAESALAVGTGPVPREAAIPEATVPERSAAMVAPVEPAAEKAALDAGWSKTRVTTLNAIPPIPAQPAPVVVPAKPAPVLAPTQPAPVVASAPEAAKVEPPKRKIERLVVDTQPPFTIPPIVENAVPPSPTVIPVPTFPRAKPSQVFPVVRTHIGPPPIPARGRLQGNRSAADRALHRMAQGTEPPPGKATPFGIAAAPHLMPRTKTMPLPDLIEPAVKVVAPEPPPVIAAPMPLASSAAPVVAPPAPAAVAPPAPAAVAPAVTVAQPATKPANDQRPSPLPRITSRLGR